MPEGKNMSRSFDLNALPYFAEPNLYLFDGNRLRAWEFSGWQPESMSWKTGCYIHAGLSGPVMVYRGDEVDGFFSSICVNGFKKFEVGAMKHAVMCTDDGLIASHGVLQKNSSTEVRFFAAGNWPTYQLSRSNWAVEASVEDIYLFQVAGPRSIDTLERVTSESLRDIGFLRYRTTTIAGHDVEIGRIGMSGNLAYEVRGPVGQGPEIYEAILSAGREFGIERLGWRTYLVNHVEGGFPQQLWTFYPALLEDEGYRSWAGSRFRTYPTVTGSVDPADMRARYRSPGEVGWGTTVRLDHDFVGRSAVAAEMNSPKRVTVTLKWNAEDVVDIYASLLAPGEAYKTIDLPTSPAWNVGYLAHADHVLSNHGPIGYSSGTIYSYFYRSVLSLACIDVEAAALGSEVIVQWGDHGGRIKNVRATVERFPYMAAGRNNAVDLSRPQPA
jgi:vanillate/3-O-methylgallate O-demethylase